MTTAQITERPVATNGLAIAALCLGITGCVFGLIPITALIALACGAVGLVLGIIAWKHAATHGRKGMAITGTLLSVLAVTLGVIGFIIVQNAVNSL